MQRFVHGLVTKKACMHIDLTHENWTRSNAAYDNSKNVKEVKLREHEARSAALATDIT